MKFIHTGDVHWGIVPDAAKPWARERAQAVKDTFRKTVEQAGVIGADFLFISGDLFHRQPLMRDLKEVNNLFCGIPDTRVVIIAGNHDRIQDNSSLLNFSWTPNVTWLMDEALTSVYFKDVNTEVYGFSYHTPEIREARLSDIQVPIGDRIRILLAHGGDHNHLPMNFHALELSPFSYIALGHVHKPQVMAPDKIAYCGSLEPLDLTETGAHGYYVGEIHPITKKVTQLTFVPAACAQYISLSVGVNPETTNLELANQLMQEVTSRGLEHIYRFRIKGTRNPDVVFDLDNLCARCKICEILDDSEPQYDFPALFAQHPGDMVGFFIQTLRKEPMSRTAKKALCYGVDALMHTADERS